MKAVALLLLLPLSALARTELGLYEYEYLPSAFPTTNQIDTPLSTLAPTSIPTDKPTKRPTKRPMTDRPSKAPVTRKPTNPPTTKRPSTKRPSKNPVRRPTRRPVECKRGKKCPRPTAPPVPKCASPCECLPGASRCSCSADFVKSVENLVSQVLDFAKCDLVPSV